MAWERRGKRTYYYTKERVNGKVVSRYMGGGEVAEAIATLNELDRRREEPERQERREFEREAKAVAQYCTEVDAIVHETLINAGFHRHNRGEWRKKRAKTDGKTTTESGAS